MAAPKPRAHLRAEGVRLWKKIHAEIPGDWQFDGRELAALESACVLADRAVELREAIESDGILVTGSTGQTTMSKLVTEERQLQLAILRLLGSIPLPDHQEAPQTARQIRGREAARKRRVAEDAWTARAEAAQRRRRDRGDA